MELLFPKNTLRPYQETGINKIFAAWRSGKRAVMFQMPTGTGKTILFSEIVRRGFAQDRKILLVVHRDFLVTQIQEKLADNHIDAGLIIAGKESDYTKGVQVASLMTLVNREHPEADLIIIDEAHHAKAETYRRLWELYPNAKILGCSATPIRYNGDGFEDLFEELIVSMPTQEFIREGYLVPVSQYACAAPDLSNVKKSRSTNDYVTDDLARVMSEKGVMGDLVESYQNICPGKSMIVFAVNVEHSKSIVERYIAAGFTAAHIDAETPDKERKLILDDFKNRRLQIISNVEIITEGFDFPECDVVQLARPTKSLAFYLQASGRCMRIAEGKMEGIILDNAGCWMAHGLAIIDREWSLKGKQKRIKGDGSGISTFALDGNGRYFKVNKSQPEEIKGLELVSLQVGFEDLMRFEIYISQARKFGSKLISAYFRYNEWLKKREKTMSKAELDYIKKRIAYFKEKFPDSKIVKDGFWWHEEQRIGKA